MINEEFLSIENSYYFILILSIGFVFQAIYQFITPIHLSYKKSNLLVMIQGGTMLVYIAIVYMFSNAFDYEKFMWLKTFLLISMTTICLISIKKLQRTSLSKNEI